MLAVLLFIGACGSRYDRAVAAFNEAQQLAAVGDFQTAEIKFGEAAALRDDLPDLWLLRARVALQRRDYNNALSYYRAAFEQDQSNREALDALGQLSIASGDVPAARRYAGQLLVLDPSSRSGKLVLGNVEFRNDRLDEAKRIADEILSTDQTIVPALVLKSRVLQRQGRLDAALQLIMPYRDQLVEDFDLLTQFRSIYTEQADGRGLLEVARALGQARPNECDAQVDLAARALAMGQTGEAGDALRRCFKNSYDERALADLEGALLDNGVPFDRVVQSLRGRELNPALLTVLLRSSQATNARAAALQITAPAAEQLKLTAESSGFFAARKLVESAAGRVSRMPSLASILALDPDAPDALLARARMRAADNKLAEARADVAIVLRDAPMRPDAILEQVGLYRREGQIALADQTLAGAAESVAGDPRVLAVHVDRLLGQRRSDAAKEAVRDYLIKNPVSVAAWRLRARLCAASRDLICAERARTMAARLLGANLPLPPVPPDERDAMRAMAQ